jgi:DNA-directed RNA polymerase sigma subunit (sigma70/sigma32)
MTREEERLLGQGIEQAWQRIRGRMCRLGMATRWHLGKARDILRDNSCLEKHVLHLEPEETSAYLEALPQLVKQVKKQDARCAALWAARETHPDLADYQREQGTLADLFLRFQYPDRAYERVVRQEPKKLLDDVRRTLAKPNPPLPEVRGLETFLRVRLQEFVDLEEENTRDGQTLDRLRAELIAGHEDFVRTVAARYGAKVPDALFYARCGLAKAAESYPVSRGYRFGTYAIWWIRAAIDNKRTWGRTKDSPE